MDDPYHWDERVDAWAEVADSDTFRGIRDRICAVACLRADDDVLDLGAGTGLIALAAAPRVAHVDAVDVSPRMLERLGAAAAADNITNVTPVIGDMRSLPIEDESATVVLSNYAFHHLTDADKELALAETRRVLKPGGRLVVCDMMFALSLERRDRILVMQKIAAIARRGPAGILRIIRNAGRVAAGRWEHPSPPEEWRRMLEDRHFVDVEVELLENEAGLATASRPNGT